MVFVSQYPLCLLHKEARRPTKSGTRGVVGAARRRLPPPTAAERLTAPPLRLSPSHFASTVLDRLFPPAAAWRRAMGLRRPTERKNPPKGILLSLASRAQHHMLAANSQLDCTFQQKVQKKEPYTPTPTLHSLLGTHTTYTPTSLNSDSIHPEAHPGFGYQPYPTMRQMPPMSIRSKHGF